MQFVEINGLHLWQFENLKKRSSIEHFVTDRRSNPGNDEFTLSLSSSPDKEAVRNNRKRLASALGIESQRLYFPSQVHKTRIVHVTGSTPVEEVLETDALITNEGKLGIAVMSADCVPILLFDTKNNAVGAVHSGWRGTVAKILEKTLQRMHSTFGTRGEDLIAGIGPSVCQESYEVGEEVVREVENAFGKESGLMIAQPHNKAKLDLWKANMFQLMDFGVRQSSIEIGDLCTVKNNDHFFSARKGDAGRFAAGIMLT
jgi:YfiH family protein